MSAELSYVLPLRWRGDEDLDELGAYLAWLAERAEVLVVDGSPPEAYRRHEAAWGGVVRHMPPHPDLRFLMGKVNGVTTGVREARHERVIVADDDVRYDEAGLERVGALLAEADLVRPQNYFEPLPWHARWDTGRTLLNRLAGGDFPGTLGVRRSAFLAMGGYEGDLIFENLELIRSVRAAGGSTLTPLDLFVARRPPSARHFLSQRVRQAYDDFALPARMAAFLAAGPAALSLALRRRPALLGTAIGAIVLAAEAGRRRGGGRRVFPASASLLAPAWVAERAVCAWLAVIVRLVRGGVPYGDVVIPRAASPRRELRRRVESGLSAPAAGRSPR